MGFKLKGSSATKKFMENQGPKSRFNQLKISAERKQYKLFILGPVGEAPLVGETNDHVMFLAGKFLGHCVSPEVDGGKDKLNEVGFKVFGKYGKSDSKKLSQAHKLFFSKKEYFINVLDYADMNGEGVPEPKVLKVPKCLFDLIDEKLKSCVDENGEPDLTEMCDFEDGFPVLLQHNGQKGLLRKYKVDWAKKPAKLISGGLLTEEDLEGLSKKCYNLDKIQRKFDADEYEKFYGIAKKEAMKAGVDIDNLSEDSDSEAEENFGDDDSFDKDIESDFE